MNIVSTDIDGVLIIEPDVFKDNRGFFLETYQKKRYAAAGINSDFIQDNLSYSVRGTLRGLHYQLPNAQAKMVQVLKGEIYDVAVDIRRGSPSFGQWIGVHLSDDNKRQLFIPEGFAHGFCVLSETALFIYKCSDYYTPESEKGILWSDPELDINWPVNDPILSEKDGRYICLSKVEYENLPVYEDG